MKKRTVGRESDDPAVSGKRERRQRDSKRRKIRSDPNDSANHTGSTSDSQQLHKPFSLVQNLPQELFDQIQDYVFESSLCPGFISLNSHLLMVCITGMEHHTLPSTLTFCALVR